MTHHRPPRTPFARAGLPRPRGCCSWPLRPARPSAPTVTTPAGPPAAPSCWSRTTRSRSARSCWPTFETESGLTVEVRQPGDAGTLVNQLVLTKDSPLGDAVYGIDNAFAGRALDADILEPYASPRADDVVDRAGGRRHRPVGPRRLQRRLRQRRPHWFADHDLAEPGTLEDLADPAYEDLLVVTEPGDVLAGAGVRAGDRRRATGTTGPTTGPDLRDNGVAVADSWSDAYYVDFSGGGGAGPRPLVLSYASSPPFTVPKGADQPTTRALLDTCFRQVEYTGVLDGRGEPGGCTGAGGLPAVRAVPARDPGVDVRLPGGRGHTPAERPGSGSPRWPTTRTR